MSYIAGEDIYLDLNKETSVIDFCIHMITKHSKDLKLKNLNVIIIHKQRDQIPLEDIVNIIAGTDFGSIETKKTGPDIEYEFLDAFPVAINSMPISYDTSQLLKCTVSMAYTRYILIECMILVIPLNWIKCYSWSNRVCCCE